MGFCLYFDKTVDRKGLSKDRREGPAKNHTRWELNSGHRKRIRTTVYVGAVTTRLRASTNI